MPRNRRVIEDNDDEGVEMEVAAAPASQSQGMLSSNEIDKKAKEVIKYLLVLDSKKAPIKRVDINKNVIKESSRHFGQIMEKATIQMKNIFGIDLIEVDKKNKIYVMVSELKSEARKHHQSSDRQLEKLGILMPIFGLIFMNENTIDDASLWHFLSKLGLSKEVTHPTFGPMEKFLKTEMAKEGYLEWTKIANTDPAQFSIQWGHRASKEVSKMDCLNFVCKVYSMKSEIAVTPQDWQVQYREAALEQEGNQEEV